VTPLSQLDRALEGDARRRKCRAPRVQIARLAGQYFKEIEGRWLMDDVSSEQRSTLRRVLEAYRSGKLSLP